VVQAAVEAPLVEVVQGSLDDPSGDVLRGADVLAVSVAPPVAGEHGVQPRDGAEKRLGGLVEVEEHVEVHEIPPKPSAASKD
jgi:hypothetical protein